MSDKSGTWIERLLDGDYRARDIEGVAPGVDWAVDGFLPATGASMWFGAGSVGKTQLLLWMAAHIASSGPNAPPTWLGCAIKRRCHVLVLSAEDLREHLLGRLKSILSVMTDAKGAPLDAKSVCERIHLLPFLSLSRTEFQRTSPSLFEIGGAWHPTVLLAEIEQAISGWNATHDPEDHIVGVILDSAVSMAGFDLSNADATARFLFHVNRTSREQNVFWAIIGHTPKNVSVDAENPGAGAVNRLRGSAIWSTSPRVVVEVRIATRENEIAAVRKARPDTPERDIVQLNVVKANLKRADHRVRTLVRQEDGAFEDVTALVGSFQPASRHDTVRAVVGVIRTMTAGMDQPSFARADLAAAIMTQRAKEPALAQLDLAYAGKDAKPDNLAGILKTLASAGVITSGRKGPCKAIDLDTPLDGAV